MHTLSPRGHFGQGDFCFSEREPPARCFFLASQNGGGVRKKMATGARTGSEPSGAHWDHRAEARDTARGPGRHTNTGHGLGTSAGWHRPSLWRLPRSERLCPPNPHIPMFDTAPVLEYPLFTMEQVPPAPVEEYVTPTPVVTYAHAFPVSRM